MGVPIHYGLCAGGPFNKRHMAHATLTYEVAIDRRTKRAAPPILRTPATEAEFRFGLYHFDEATQTWVWEGEP